MGVASAVAPTVAKAIVALLLQDLVARKGSLAASEYDATELGSESDASTFMQAKISIASGSQVPEKPEHFDDLSRPKEAWGTQQHSQQQHSEVVKPSNHTRLDRVSEPPVTALDLTDKSISLQVHVHAGNQHQLGRVKSWFGKQAALLRFNFKIWSGFAVPGTVTCHSPRMPQRVMYGNYSSPIWSQFINDIGRDDALICRYNECEALRVLNVIRAPSNAWSSLAFAFVGLLMLADTVRTGGRSFVVCHLSCAICLVWGCASFLYHASVTTEFLKIDLRMMYCGLFAIMLGNVVAVVKLDSPKWAFTADRVCGWLHVAMLFCVDPSRVNIALMTGALSFVIVVLDMWLICHGGHIARAFMIALVMFSLSGVGGFVEYLGMVQCRPSAILQPCAVMHICVPCSWYLRFRTQLQILSGTQQVTEERWITIR
mmetsp:Transcript_126901/g.224970  ORF Transcript_126901/g.224970 Transcript_126901/m.224970 type:complete len:429 (+) Transcript_126901:177-1463(+)